jgi:hypothetical protein
MHPSELNPNKDPDNDNPALSRVIEKSELADLEMETRPEDVLAEIHPLQAIELSKR